MMVFSSKLTDIRSAADPKARAILISKMNKCYKKTVLFYLTWCDGSKHALKNHKSCSWDCLLW
jgi:hypothetical protein